MDHCVCHPEGRRGKEHACRLARGRGPGHEGDGLRRRHGPPGSLTNWARTRALRRHHGGRLGSGAPSGTLAGLAAKGFTLADHRHARRGGSGLLGGDGDRRPQHHSGPAEPVRPVGKRQHARRPQGDRRRLRVPSQPVPAGAAIRARRDGAEALEEMGALITPLDPGAGRLSGGGAPRLWRHRAQSQWRRRRGDARPLDIDPRRLARGRPGSARASAA